MAKGKNGCTYNGIQYSVDETICMDGLLAVCGPDGKWQVSAETCTEGNVATEPPSTMMTVKPKAVIAQAAEAANTQSRFPDDVIAAARRAEQNTGCLASVTLAQWAQESGFGKYQLHANNPFGLKWFEGCKYGFVIVPTREFLHGNWTVEMAKFISFPSLEDAFDLHGQILMNPKGPYKSALQLKNNWKEYIEAIAKIYATDPNYGKSLISLVQTYGLNQFDSPQ